MRSTDEPWETGDRALAMEPVGRTGPRGGVVDRLAVLADELGIAPKTLRIRRGVAKAWPKTKRRETMSWSVHAMFRGQPDRYDLIRQRDWTTRQAKEFVQQRNS